MGRHQELRGAGADRTGTLRRFFEEHAQVMAAESRLDGLFLCYLAPRPAALALLTGDKNMDKQQRLEGRPFAVLIMSAIGP
jgi:hypothetical protein